jgi:ligand-binding sensor domain-containing protein
MRVILTVLLIVCSYFANAQQPFVRDFPLTETHTPVKVNALQQGAIGYIWLGTDNGLFSYNGSKFVKIQDSVHQPVTAVAVAGKTVWVGYSNGKIGVVSGQVVFPLYIKNGPSSSVTSLHAAGKGLLIAGTEEQGLFVIMNGVAMPFNTANGLSDDFVYDFAISGNRLLVATDEGINDISLAGNRISVNKYTTRDGLPDNIVSCISKIPGTRLYLIGTQEKGIAIYDDEHKTINSILDEGEEWAYGQVNYILPVAGYRAWAATEDGYLLEIKMNNGTAECHPVHYPGKSLEKLLLDRAGNIWCGTNKGLMMVTGEYLRNIRLGAPYSLYDVTAMVWDNNSLLVALKKDLYQLLFKDTIPSMEHIFTANANITSLFIDKEDRLWIGTFGDGLYYEQNGNTAIKLEGIEELGEDASVLSISGTPNNIWLAGLKGVEELSYPVDGKINLVKHHGKKTGIGSDYVYQLFPDSKGNMWMATDGAGVCMYDGQKYYHWDSTFAAGSKVVYSITEDKAGDVWAATMQRDLHRYHNGNWENLRLPETQFPDINISAVMANASGQVISVYQRCIDEWYPKSRYFRHYNSALGIGIDSTSNALNCLAKDNEGNVYLPYQHGIIVFKNKTAEFDIAPAVLIAHPTIYSKAVSGNKHKFTYDENYIGFAFDGISYTNHERLNYRYMLEGYNDDWIYTNDAAASFPKLPPGDYKFRVQVALNPAFDHPGEDSYSFTIAAPFWKTNLFYVLGSIFVFLLLYLYIKLRERRLKSISRLQQERMMFEYEHLRSQVNPHFLFNSLYALSILIEEKKESAVDYTTHLADLYRNMLTHSKKDLIPLKDELEILENYIHIQQTRFGDALKVKIDIPDEVLETKKIVPLAIQLLVENAIKHNVVSAAHPLAIYITATKHELTVRNPIQPKISQEKGEGIGLVNIKQRYALLTKSPVSFGVHGSQFVVQLPLL